MNDTKLWVALSGIEGVGIATLQTIYSAIKNAGISLYDIIDCSPKEIAYETGLSIEVSQHIAKLSSNIAKIEKDYEAFIDNTIEPILFFDSRYPKKLLQHMQYSPPIIYAYGNTELFKSKRIAILSDSQASERGYHIAYHAADIAAQHSIAVVSGMAKGPQTIAHRGAIEAGGTTISVLPYGIFNLQIPDILKDILDMSRWLFISPFEPNEAYALHNSYKRNSLIAAMVDALIIVETSNDGGCFEAAKSAVKYKTPLFVVEYAQYPQSALGNPILIKDYSAIPLRGRLQNDILIPNMDTCIAKVRYGDSK
ncbi:MAG: DNA-processing protein DprA [Spirochaetota bacterium]